MEVTVSDGSLKNVEIKARIHDIDLLLQKAKSIADQPEVLLIQEDTYFRITNGRLKIREIKGQESQLVFYQRPNVKGPKLSQYSIQKFKDEKEAAGLKTVLQASLGTVGVIKKKRHLFIANQTRIHVDEVENLGCFMELEEAWKAVLIVYDTYEESKTS